MGSKTRSRLVMLGILVTAGLLAAGAGMAFGAEGMFSGDQKDIRAVVNGTNVKIYEDDHEVHNFTLPEGRITRITLGTLPGTA